MILGDILMKMAIKTSGGVIKRYQNLLTGNVVRKDM